VSVNFLFGQKGKKETVKEEQCSQTQGLMWTNDKNVWSIWTLFYLRDNFVEAEVSKA